MSHETVAHHIGSIDRRGHLDFPEVLALCQLLGAANGSCATAVVGVKAHLPAVAAEEGSRGLEVLVPYPVKTWKHTRRVQCDNSLYFEIHN